MEGELISLVEGEVVEPDAQRRSKIARHPRREQVEALIRAGKSSLWISRWTEEEYPTEEDDPDDPEGEPLRHPDWRRNRRLQLSEKVIEAYRRRWMPGFSEGIDVVSSELEDLVGRVFPPPSTHPWELDVMGAQVRVAEQMLVTQMEFDGENSMGVSENAIELSRLVGEHANARLEAASKLGRPGYEAAPERQSIDMSLDQRSVNVNLNGRIDQDGNPVANEPKKVETLQALIQRGPEEVERVLEAARAVEAQAASEEVIDGADAGQEPAEG